MKSEEWDAYGRRVEAHLAQVEAEIGALRDSLRDAGIMVHRQRTRIQPENEKANRARVFLEAVYPQALSPSQVAGEIDCSPEYAYDILMALVAKRTAERIGRGKYRSVGPAQAVKNAISFGPLEEPPRR
jgi:hypothetical protein